MPTISPFSKPGGGNQTAPEGDKEVDGPASSRMKRPGTWKSSRLGPSKELRRAKTKLRSMMRWGAAGLCLWGPAGCAPKIYRFDVLPYAVCVGTPSTVSWHIKGKPELTLTPPSQPISTKPRVYAPTVETKVVLRVRRGPHPDQTAPTSMNRPGPHVSPWPLVAIIGHDGWNP